MSAAMPTQSSKKGTFQCPKTRRIGPSVRILQLNIEGISQSKTECLCKILKNHSVDVVLLQETHTADAAQLARRGTIPGFNLTAATYHAKYGTATYVRSSVTGASHIISSGICPHSHLSTIVSQLDDLKICNVYKPPNSTWPLSPLPDLEHPSVYMGDFNSHHTSWGYRSNDRNGETLSDWSDKANAHLVINLKERGTFKSARWKTDHNPDLLFVSTDAARRPITVARRVLDDFPNSQHRPVLAEIGIQIPLVKSFPTPRWNFRKAKWDDFSVKLDECVRWIPPLPQNYPRFVKLIYSIAKDCIPRGFRKEYIPSWSKETEDLWNEFGRTGDRVIGHRVISSLDEARREKWERTVSDMNFTHSSRKAWHTLKRLSSQPSNSVTDPPVKVSDIASRIVKLSKAPSHKTHTKATRKELKRAKSEAMPDPIYSRPVTLDEVSLALKKLKTGKACGSDGIFPEFLKYSGCRTRTWLAKFYTNIIECGKVPQQLKRAKIVAILKPGKPKEEIESYRPIALLSAVYKLLERIIYNRISDTVDQFLPAEQGGFRPNRSCCDQVLALTTHLEHGFHNHLKSAAAFVDLTAAYDTVWREGLLLKLLKVIPCLKIFRLLEDALSNRPFQVHLGNHASKTRTLNNGLPQGSVLAPLLFNLYIHDIPITQSRKFGYADDLALVTQSKDLADMETVLEADLASLDDYFTRWRLRPNPAKTEVCCFHLSNKEANRELSVQFRDSLLKHNHHPKYLGVTLDRSLTFKEHLQNSSQKLKTRNNILLKLTGTTWGAPAACLRITALALIYSTAEYCAPVWMNSAHTQLVDTQLNNAMRTITGCIKPTPNHWLPALSCIEPPHLRRHTCLAREIGKIRADPSLPIHRDLADFHLSRLKSRHPPALQAHDQPPPKGGMEAWRKDWDKYGEPTDLFQFNPRNPSGFDLPRRAWCLLNRLRTGYGNCAQMWKRWGWCESASCPCGCPEQSVRHMLLECPLTKYSGPSTDFRELTSDAVAYLANVDIDI